MCSPLNISPSTTLRSSFPCSAYANAQNLFLNNFWVRFEAVWRIPNVMMRIRIRIPLFKLMRIFIFFSLHNLTKLVMCYFLTNNEGGGARDEV